MNMSSRAVSQNENSEPTLLPGTHPDDIHAWLANLPMAHCNRSAQILYDGLLELRRTEQATLERLACLELFRAPIIFISAGLLKNYLSNTTVSTQERRKMMELSQLLQIQLAKSYESCLLGSAIELPEDHIATVVHRALYHLNSVFLRHYQSYYEVPADLWAMLFRLYQCAKNHDCLSLPVEDEHDDQVSGLSIEALFKIATLLNAANPYQLKADDTGFIFTALHQWQEHVEIHDAPEADDLYVVDLSGQNPPSFYSLQDKSGPQDSLCGIDPSDLIRFIKEDAHDDPRHHLSKNLYHHLIRTWSSFPSRAFVRSTASGDITACIGLSATHHYINGEMDVTPDLSVASHTDENPSAADELLARADKFELKPMPANENNRFPGGKFHRPNVDKNPWQKIYGPNDGVDEYEGEHAKPQSKKPSYPSHHWRLVNSSDNGYCLCTTADFCSDIRVGELIGMQEKEGADQNYWHIGTVRWIKFDDNDDVQIGIQLLAPNAIAVGIQNEAQQSAKSNYLRALLLPAVKALNIPRTLITPTLHYKSGEKIHAVNHTIDSDFKLTTQLFEGTHYNQFEFEELTHFAGKIDFEGGAQHPHRQRTRLN